MKLIDIINASNEITQISIVVDFHGMPFASSTHFAPYFFDGVDDEILEASVVDLWVKDGTLMLRLKTNEAE